MTYLTYEEYNDMGFAELEKKDFDKLAKHAGDAIDSITRDFYVFNDLEDDVKFRRVKFKKAVAAQVEYFHEMGATSTHGMNSPLSVQIGRTQMSSGVANQKDMNKLISKDVYMYLEGIGLLYRGIGVI